MRVTDPPKTLSIAIVGGGIGGLCLAVALTRHNVPVHVYEAAPAFTEIGAGVGLGPNALRAMRILDPAILAGYKRCETKDLSPAEQGRFFNFRYGMDAPSCNGMGAGDLICDVRSGGVTSSVHRAKLLKELVLLMPKGRASFGKKLVAVNARVEGVTLRFGDGTQAIHDAVVGCDGVKSQMRRILLGEGNEASKPVFTGKCCFRGIAPMEKAIETLGEDMATESQMYLGKGGHVLTTPIEQGKSVNIVAYHSHGEEMWNEEAWIKPSTKTYMLSKFQGFSQAVRNLLNLIEKPDIWALFDHLPAASYHSKGKICLLGDSAHASTPHHGAGAGMAVEDAMILSQLLASIREAEDIENVFIAYDTVRRPRTQRLVASSRRMGRVYDFEDPDIGDDIGAMRDHLNQAWDWIWKEDLDRQLEKARIVLKGLVVASKASPQ